MNALLRTVGDQFARARQVQGLTVSDVARRCRLTVDVVHAVETGRRDVSLWMVARVCVAVGVRMSRVIDAAEQAGIARGLAPWFDAPTDVIDIHNL